MKNELEYCYNMGKDCAFNGANQTNSHFSLFSTSDKLKAWEQGYKDGLET